MKISVIMLTYNRENLVARAIESVLAQTFRDFEFIIVDNGSTDRSGAIADEYAARDSRIRVIHRTRGNIGSGRNVGLDAAKGEYIAFVDDDDRILPDFLRFLHNLVVESDADVAICGTNLLHSESKFVMTAEDAIITLLWRKYYNNGFPTKLFRRDIFGNLHFIEEGRYDDIGLMYKVLAGCQKIVYHGLSKYVVHRHDGNNSAPTVKDTSITADYIDYYRRAYRARRIWLSDRFPNNAEYWQYFDWSFMISMVEKIHRLMIEGCGRQLEVMMYELHDNYDAFMNSPHMQGFEREWMLRYFTRA